VRWPYSGMQKTFKPEKGDIDYHSDEEEADVQLYPPELAGDNDEIDDTHNSYF